MKKDIVGVRFAPTGEELIIYYLMNKILGYTYLVDEAINEINILSYEPWNLPRRAKINSGDLAWYFFSPIVYANTKNDNMKRTLDSGNGFWKSSGIDRTIKSKRISKGEIGIKKSFTYHKKGSKSSTPWVMHEYHITCLSELSPERSNYVQNNYVICKVMYNGEDEDITFGGDNQSGQSQSLVSSGTSCNTGPELMKEQEDVMWYIVANTLNIGNNNHSVQLEVSPHLTPEDSEFIAGLKLLDPRPVENLFSMEPDFGFNFNIHIPKKPLSGTIDYSSDSDDDDDDDAESTSELSYQGASSPESVRNSNRHFLQTDGDEILLANRSMDKTEEKQDRLRAVDTSMDKKKSMVKTEKKSRFIAEKAMETNHKNPRYVYPMNAMISFILLLAYFGYIYIGFKMKFD